ncbi:MAG: hypothetical protein F9K35_18765 [Burkholderiaceae bacterium]|nr:MAG: hypothetical protein F9K35_18765 [Burkholderiaceae bacterium]
MKAALRILVALSALAALAACGERPQTAGGSKHGAPSYAGPQSPFTAPGWKVDDKTSWEQHLRSRQQYGQNEYTRTH